MANKISEISEMVSASLVKSYKMIEDSVVNAYHKVENTVLDTYQKVEDKMVEQLFVRGEESVDEAKARLRGENDEK